MAAVYPIPETVGVSELRLRQREIIAKLSKGPVLLTQRNRATAVLISVELWNRVLEELADLRDAQIAMERLEEARRDPARVQAFEDVEAELVGDSLLKT